MRRPVVDDIMTRDVIHIDEESTLGQAENLMKERGVRKLIVTRGGQPVRVLEVDKIWGRDRKQRIREVAHELEPAYTVRSGTPLDDVRQQMEARSAIVVMDRDGKAMIGVFTATDIKNFTVRLLDQRPWQQWRGPAQRGY